MKKILYYLKSLKYLFKERFYKIKTIELSTGINCDHYYDYLKNCIVVKTRVLPVNNQLKPNKTIYYENH